MASVDMKELGKDTQFKSGKQAAENGRKGGIASGVSKRRKKTMKEALEILLAMPIKPGDIKDLEDIPGFENLKGQNITVNDAIQIKMVQKALKGDRQAAEFVRNTAGQNPTEKIDLAAQVTPMVIKDDVTE